MDGFREFCGYILGLVFCAATVLLCAIAWFGLENMFGWRWALAGIVLSVLVRINFPVVIGLYFYAHNIWDWPMAESIAFALPGLLIIVPSVATGVFSLLVGTAARR
ncbi:MAG: hypothetical protein ACOYLS_13610 [Polymorphobacter sp.]